jgi:signal transduction histidine kinase
VPFALRRAAPRLVFGILATCFGVALLLGAAGTGVGIAFAAYTVLVRDRRWVGVVVIGVGYGLIVLAYLTLPDTTASTFFLDAITFAMVIGLAELVRTRQAYDEIYRERAAQLERERVTLAEKAVNEERLRIARELHDVVAHAISLIAVQSSVALERLRKDPDGSSRALETIETSSRSALEEMRRMLAILRHDDESLAQLQPSAGVADLPSLAREAEAAGVATRLLVEGERPLAVPSGVDLCGYRIVQEALTNVLRHAGASSAAVSVAIGTRSLEIDVRDDGSVPVATPAPAGAGSGLRGMAERAEALGGRVEAGRRAGGGWQVHATLPLS